MGKFVANFIGIAITAFLLSLGLIGLFVAAYEVSGALGTVFAWFADCDHDDAFMFGVIAGCTVSGLLVAAIGMPLDNDREEKSNDE